MTDIKKLLDMAEENGKLHAINQLLKACLDQKRLDIYDFIKENGGQDDAKHD